MRTNIPAFRLPSIRARRRDRHDPRHGRRGEVQPSGHEHEGAAGRRLRRGLHRQRRAQGQGARHPRPLGRPGPRAHRHRLAGVDPLRPHHQRRRTRAGDRRGQHRHGLLPLLQAAGRQRREGDGPPRTPLLQGLALGAGRRRGGAGRDPREPRALVVRDRERARARNDVRPARVVRRRRQAEEQEARREVPARPGRDPGHRTGDGLPLDRARHRHRVQPVGPAGGRSQNVPDLEGGRVLWRRRRVGSGEHHLGRPPRSRSVHLHPQLLQRHSAHRAPTGGHDPGERQAGHARLELPQRLQPLHAAEDGARGPRGAPQEDGDRGRAGLRPGAGRARGAALPQLRHPDALRGAALHRVRRLHRRLPGELPDDHGRRRGDGSAHPPPGARRQPQAGDLPVRCPAADGARHGEGRGHLRALRALRGALPHGRVGHGEVRSPDPLRWSAGPGGGARHGTPKTAGVVA